MEDNIINKFISKIKNSFNNDNKVYPSNNEYAFSSEEIDEIRKANQQKIMELKQDLFAPKQKKSTSDNNLVVAGEEKVEKKGEEVSKVSEENKETVKEVVAQKIDLEEEPEQEKEEVQPKNSFVNLSLEYQNLVMEKWNSIATTQIDKDIIEGKDLLNHNYTITYADDAARYIHKIRKEYEVVICYLIGFNNEKKGEYDKTIFSAKIDDEWKFLSNYIKILEKIRNFKK